MKRADGSLALAAAALKPAETVTLKFADGERGAMIDGAPTAASRARPAADPSQGDLF